LGVPQLRRRGRRARRDERGNEEKQGLNQAASLNPAHPPGNARCGEYLDGTCVKRDEPRSPDGEQSPWCRRKTGSECTPLSPRLFWWAVGPFRPPAWGCSAATVTWMVCGARALRSPPSP
jgi:hypothetical protein